MTDWKDMTPAQRAEAVKDYKQARAHQDKVQRKMEREGNDNPNDRRYVEANDATGRAAAKVPWYRR